MAAGYVRVKGPAVPSGPEGPSPTAYLAAIRPSIFVQAVALHSDYPR